jgi:presenilin-like A22 family membrane protease
MKHSQQVLILFMALFLVSQLIGLSLVTMDLNVVEVIDEENETTVDVVFGNTTVGERPEMEGTQTLISILLGVSIGTIILLILSRFKKVNLWKHWFFFASLITMSVSFGVLFNNYIIAWIIAGILAAWKIYKPNFIIHNFTELFIYPGIALLIAPVLNVFIAFILLIIISIYDAYAVWKSKHMIKMAMFVKSTNLFPGLAITYDENTGKIVNQKNKSNKETKTKTAKSRKNKEEKGTLRHGILGGGDIAFPLLFVTTFLIFLIEQGYSKFAAITYSFIISVFAGLALLLLFVYGKKDRFYPAMPYISAGCFIGYIVVMILINIL